MKTQFIVLTFSLITFQTQTLAAPVDRACTERETWDLKTAEILPFQESLKKLITRRLSPIRGFAESLALRRLSQTPEQRAFAEYFLARSLFEAKLPHIAFQAMGAILSKPVLAETANIQSAALECVNRIHAKYPTFEITNPMQGALAGILKHAAPERKGIVYDGIVYGIMTRLSDESSLQAIKFLIEQLEGSPLHVALIQGLVDSRNRAHANSIAQLEKYFNLLKTQPAAEGLIRFDDLAHLTLARSYYTLGGFKKAIPHYQAVSKNSNQLAQALQELGWSFLQADQYTEAVGTGISLQAGALRHTFVPESLMVMAMALNELCQFPDSLKAINNFKKNYEPVYKWLQANLDKKELYPVAVKYLRAQLKGGRAVAAARDLPPSLVANEWVRSPVFISHQDEINLLFDEKESMSKLPPSAIQEQKTLALEIRKNADDLKLKIREAKKRRKPGESWPKSVTDGLAQLKASMTSYKRLRDAAPVFQSIAKNFTQQSPGRQGRLLAMINKTIHNMNAKMNAQLEEIAENNQLVEVEIFNGASQDIIWQNAHPDYREIALKLKKEREESKGQVLDWGKSAIALDTEEVAEIWEDELGSFKADVFDNCSNREKFLAIKRKG